MARAALSAMLGLVALLAHARVAEGQVSDVRLPFRTLRTAHFDITYHAPLGLAARRLGLVVEEAHAGLVPIMGSAPDRRVQIVLTDGSEAANGSATALPYDAIRLFATAPDDLSPLADYDDWLSMLVTHEHTHVLHLDNIGGIPSVVNAIVGKVWAPNHLLPRFVVEGFAVYLESARSSAGRLRSSQFEMYMRMATLEDNLLRLDQLSHGIDEWPFGNAFYLYGSRFIEWVVREHGEGVLAEISAFYGRRAVPYGVSRAFQRATGRTIEELYAGFLEAMRREHGEVRARVEAHARGRVEGERLTHHGLSVQYPRFLDGETLVYRVSDGHSDNQLRTLSLRSPGESGELSRVSGSTYPSPHPDGSVYADMLDSVRDIYVLYDLFRLDVRGRGRTAPPARADRLGWDRLTYGLRARAPDVSPDGRRIAFTSNGAGTSHLMIADTADVQRTARPLLRSRRFDQVFTPRFSPDGRFVAASVWERGGLRDVLIIDVETGERRRITHDRAMDTGPTWSPDGAYVYFSSDRTGIANLYRYRLEGGALEQVTNVLAGAYMPVVSPDGARVVYVGYTSVGFDLYSLALADAEPWPALPYVDARPPSRSDSEIAALRSARYRPARTLYPRNIAFELGEDGFGQNLALQVYGEDIAGFYSWSARLGMSLVNAQPQADAQFNIRRLATPVTLSFFRRASPRGGLVVGGEAREWTENAIGGSASIRYALPDAFHYQSLTASYALTHIGKAEPFGGVLDPNDPPPQLPLVGFFAGASLGYSFSDVRRHSFDISASEGRSFGASISAGDPVLGSQYRIAALTWFFNRYFEMPFVQHHVLALHYAGGISGGEIGRRRIFFLGGFPEVSILDAFLDSVIIGGQALRGYRPSALSGTRYQLMQLEYRLPIYRPQVGYATLPLFLRRIYGSAFLDVGDAYETFDPARLRVGVGAELLVDFATWYVVEWTLRLGFAQGLMSGGGSHFYAHFGVPF